MSRFFITGDTHRNFDRVKAFCQRFDTSASDTLIILGDAGINFYGDDNGDRELKQELSRLPITLFCVHGNHEMRPDRLPGYHPTVFEMGIAQTQPEYPNLIFALDGQVYRFDGLECLVVGGAYSVDKPLRLQQGLRWFPDEQPDANTKDIVEQTIREFDRKLDVVLTHTCPGKFTPAEAFIPNVDPSSVDHSTEDWLDALEDELSPHYKAWYCGHWHTDKTVDRVRFIYNDIIELRGETLKAKRE